MDERWDLGNVIFAGWAATSDQLNLGVCLTSPGDAASC